MKLPILLIIAAIALFVLSFIPKIQRPWMIGFGLALFAASFLPYLNLRLGG